MKLNDNNENSHLISIGHIDIDHQVVEPTYDPNDLPIIPTRNLVLFPQVTIPIKLVRDNSLQTAQIAKRKGIVVGIVCQRDPDEETPTIDGLNRYGVFAEVLQIIQLPDDSQTAIVKALGKFRISGRGINITIPEAEISASVKRIKEVVPKENDKEFSALCDEIKSTAHNIAQKSTSTPKEIDFLFNLSQENASKVEMVNLICTHMPADISQKMSLLSMYRVKDRAASLFAELVKQEEMLNIAETMHQKARESFDDQQRRLFLQRQMEAIDQELNGDDNDIAELRERASTLNLNDKVAKHVSKEINKLERLNIQTPDYSVQYAYLDTLLELPWGIETPVTTDFSVARYTLDRNHYGLDKIKERVLEQIAVILNNPEGKSPIICFVGPPGVGKTSLGQSIADALGRKFARVSLGGVHDEAEIRGHRRTYIGAMPGRIIDAIRRSGSSNPVIMLDEIDKLGNDYKGDPSSALLEVLDPEQNCRFHDNYIDVDFDLSKSMFIATANTLGNLPQPLIDRMEVIDIAGYLPEEKIEIAKRHIIPRMLRELNISAEQFKIDDDAISAIVGSYTSESGVRQLEKQLYSVARKMLLRKFDNKQVPETIKRENLKDILGAGKYTSDRYESNDIAGVATGLAWTATGGEILFIEASLSPGKGDKLTLTGNLGDVMKESAMIALEYVRAHATDLGIDLKKYENFNLHIHVPEGAIPKDGPSAGITMAASITSALTGKSLRDKTAMTGEITLRGKVLPVGGIKEKILAAKRAGVTDILIPSRNRSDVEEIGEPYLEGLNFRYIDTVNDGLSYLLDA